jgi:formyl-CoA transferase
MIAPVEHPVAGAFAMPGCPIRLEQSPVQVQAAPLLGQHNTEVYSELLGYTPEQVQALKAQKII